jgi:hypothetical protein
LLLSYLQDVLDLTVMTDIPPDDHERRRRNNTIGLVITAVLVIGSVALLLSLHQGIHREDCFAAGHRTCAPIDER